MPRMALLLLLVLFLACLHPTIVGQRPPPPPECDEPVDYAVQNYTQCNNTLTFPIPSYEGNTTAEVDANSTCYCARRILQLVAPACRTSTRIQDVISGSNCTETLNVTESGEVDPDTGMACNTTQFDKSFSDYVQCRTVSTPSEKCLCARIFLASVSAACINNEGSWQNSIDEVQREADVACTLVEQPAPSQSPLPVLNCYATIDASSLKGNAPVSTQCPAGSSFCTAYAYTCSELTSTTPSFTFNISEQTSADICTAAEIVSNSVKFIFGCAGLCNGDGRALICCSDANCNTPEAAAEKAKNFTFNNTPENAQSGAGYVAPVEGSPIIILAATVLFSFAALGL